MKPRARFGTRLVVSNPGLGEQPHGRTSKAPEPQIAVPGHLSTWDSTPHKLTAVRIRTGELERGAVSTTETISRSQTGEILARVGTPGSTSQCRSHLEIRLAVALERTSIAIRLKAIDRELLRRARLRLGPYGTYPNLADEGTIERVLDFIIPGFYSRLFLVLKMGESGDRS